MTTTKSIGHGAMLTELKRIAHELRTYNPAADEHKGAHIHGVWARELDKLQAALSSAAGGAVVLSDEWIQDVTTKAVREGRLSWAGYQKDSDGKYTIPLLSQGHYQFARAILAATQRAEPVAQSGDEGLRDVVEAWERWRDAETALCCDEPTEADERKEALHRTAFAILMHSKRAALNAAPPAAVPVAQFAQDTEDYNALLSIVSDIVEAGYLNTEDLARLRAHLGCEPAILAATQRAEPVAQSGVVGLREALENIVEGAEAMGWNTTAARAALNAAPPAAVRDAMQHAEKWREFNGERPAPAAEDDK